MREPHPPHRAPENSRPSSEAKAAWSASLPRGPPSPLHSVERQDALVRAPGALKSPDCKERDGKNSSAGTGQISDGLSVGQVESVACVGVGGPSA